MEISYASEQVKKLCEEPKRAVKALGADSARKLRTRLAELDAAASVLELPAGHPHPLKRDRAGQFAVSLAGGCRLIFEPANDPVPKRADASIDWALVTKVRILEAADYHD